MLNQLRTILDPARYQGRRHHSPYFEGWYFKLVDRAEQQRYAIIPAVFLTEGGEGPHAFIQVLDGVSGRMTYIPYPLHEFQAAPDRFEVRVGPNHFASTSMQLDIQQPDLSLQGTLHFDKPQPWPVTVVEPGIMGWFAWVPRMECYHGVVSLDHALEGTLTLNGQALDFSGGRGYIEKDWGQSFPSGWVWMQTNHFAAPGTCLTGSIAMIPWVRQAFRGFIVGLLHQGTLYRFATYTGAKTEYLHISDEAVTWHITDKLYSLTINAHRGQAVELRGPSKVDMGKRVPEMMTAEIEVRLATRRGDRVIFEGRGRNGGLEVAGDLTPLEG